MGKRPGEIDQRPAEIEAQIEDTRAEMSETIDAIQGRLSPAHLKEQAKEQVQGMYQEAKDSVRGATIDRAKGAGSSMWETIKENPVPAAIAALSVGWLWRKSSQSSTEQRGSPRPRTYYQPYEVSSYQGGSTTGHMQEHAGQMAGQARETVDQLGEQAREQVAHFAGAAQHQTQAAGDRLQRMLHENPMGVAAAALALGAAVGLSLPETRLEDQYMGEARDRLMHEAEERARDTMHKVQHVAEEAQQTAREEASKQGLAS